MAWTLKQLRYFTATAEAGGIAEASRRLNISQPAIAAAIDHLEAAWGLELFLRQRARGMVLTGAGERMLAETRSFLDHAEGLQDAAEGLGQRDAGPIAAGFFITFAPLLAPSILKWLTKDLPGLEPRFIEGDLERCQGDLLEGRTELALTYDLDLSERLEKVKVAELGPHVLLSAKDPLARKSEITLEELVEQPMVLLDLPHSRDYFRAIFLTLGLEPRIAHRSPSVEMVRALVANGNGFSLLNIAPRNTRSYDGQRLVMRPLAQAIPGAPIVIASLAGVRPTGRAAALRQSLQRFFETQEALDLLHPPETP